MRAIILCLYCNNLRPLAASSVKAREMPPICTPVLGLASDVLRTQAHRRATKANGATSVAGQPGPFWKEGSKESLEEEPRCAHKGWVDLWQLWQNLSRIRKGLRFLCSACIPSLLKWRMFSKKHCRNALWESDTKLYCYSNFTLNIKPTQCFSTEVTPNNQRIYRLGQMPTWFIHSGVYWVN